MDAKITEIKRYVDERADEYLAWLIDVLKIPSVSATSQCLFECSEAVCGFMRRAGLKAEILEGYKAPAVYASHDEGSETTLFVYGHYDVQPPGPLEMWRSNPFEPLVKDGVVYARGVADNKGQFMAHIAAVEALRRGTGKVGCNLRILIEGGEEVGSPDLEKIFEDHRGKFIKADAALSADALQHPAGNPFILPGLKGGMSIELSANGAKTECHGAMADIVPNPLWKIIHALSCIKTDDVNVAVEGFYDHVRPLSDEEVKLLSEAPNPLEELRTELELKRFLPQAEKNFHMARTMPTCNVSLISDGNTGASPRFSIPTSARAVLRINLVPDQDPKDIADKVKAHLERHGFGDVGLSVLSATPPSMTDAGHPYVRYAADVARCAFGRRPLIYPRVVGSGPDYHFTRTLGLPSVWVPYAGADAETHAPNENMTVKAYIEGIYYSALFFSSLSGFMNASRSAEV